MIKRITPPSIYDGYPCSMVAVGCALGDNHNRILSKAIGLRGDGYLTLERMNKYVRNFLSVQKKEYYRKGSRPILKDFIEGNKGKAVVCLLGHYVYIEEENYWSFFKNENDEVVCVWWLKK